MKYQCRYCLGIFDDEDISKDEDNDNICKYCKGEY